MTAIDLFAGPGGLDLAAARLGIPTYGIEFSPDACATRRAAGLPTIEGDVRDYGPADFPTADTLLGGPPCQPFSVAGNGEGRTLLAHLLRRAKFMAARETPPAAPLDERSTLVLEPLRWALEAMDAGRPYRTIVLEQVPQVLPVWQTYADLLRAEGYTAVCGVLNAVEYGVPQTRRRAVLVASLDRSATLPVPTHRPYRRSGPVSTPMDELARLPFVSMGDALPHRGEFTVISNYGTGGDPKNRGRRQSTAPAATVTGKISRFRIVAPDDSELPRFTAAEAGQLQTFPADYPWTGRDIGQQVGNAVPPLLAAHVLSAATGIPMPAALEVAA
jgi:DNA (cytosine-5)-methyltransferase 1